MKNLSSALMWGGLALVLLPVAAICLFLIVALAIASPVGAFIVIGIVALVVNAIRSGPAETKPRPREDIDRAVRSAEAKNRIRRSRVAEADTIDQAEGEGRR